MLKRQPLMLGMVLNESHLIPGIRWNELPQTPGMVWRVSPPRLGMRPRVPSTTRLTGSAPNTTVYRIGLADSGIRFKTAYNSAVNYAQTKYQQTVAQIEAKRQQVVRSAYALATGLSSSPTIREGLNLYRNWNTALQNTLKTCLWSKNNWCLR